jgi:GNAT superfamily N-acetyltransferase
MRVKSLGPRGQYATRLLAPPDIAAVQSLFVEAADYFELATGAPPGPDEAQRAFVAGPPTKAVEDKRIIGVFDGGDRLVGVLDALVDFPGGGEWTMGMLLLDPRHRGVGLGRAVLEQYESWAAACGARRLHTALVAHHGRGIHFLEAAGYTRRREVKDYDAGGRRASVVFFQKEVRSERGKRE